jgi:hypothetical protein
MTTNSHVCPKRMGDHLSRVVYNSFVSTLPALSIDDEIWGITVWRLTLGLAHMNLVCGLWPRCEGFILFSSPVVNHYIGS